MHGDSAGLDRMLSNDDVDGAFVLALSKKENGWPRHGTGCYKNNP